jgi:hypothetical protein
LAQACSFSKRAFRRCLLQIGPERKSANYESHYAIGEGEQASNDGANLDRFIVYLRIRLLGERAEGEPGRSDSDMLSSEKPCIDRPGAWPNHRQRAAQRRDHERHPDISPARKEDPELDRYDERSDNGRP